MEGEIGGRQQQWEEGQQRGKGRRRRSDIQPSRLLRMTTGRWLRTADTIRRGASRSKWGGCWGKRGIGCNGALMAQRRASRIPMTACPGSPPPSSPTQHQLGRGDCPHRERNCRAVASRPPSSFPSLLPLSSSFSSLLSSSPANNLVPITDTKRTKTCGRLLNYKKLQKQRREALELASRYDPQYRELRLVLVRAVWRGAALY
eukprot:245206-Rhodomonas_salina.1